MKTLPQLPRMVTDAAVFILLLALWSGVARAQPDPQQRPDGPLRGGPPAESLAACKSLAAGNACSFTHDSHALKGTCWAPEGRPLACRPSDAPLRGQAAPPSGK